jgi:DNA-binding IscR family transcriptional regulator
VKLSARSRYGARLLPALAEPAQGRPIHLREVARRKELFGRWTTLSPGGELPRLPGLAEAGQAFYDKLKSLTLAELLHSGQESSEGKAHV